MGGASTSSSRLGTPVPAVPRVRLDRGSGGASHGSRRPGASRAAPAVRSDESRRGEREAAHRERLAPRPGQTGPRGTAVSASGRGAARRAGRALQGGPGLHQVPAARDPHQGGFRGRQRRRRADVRRRGARGRGGSPGSALRRPCRPASQPDAGGASDSAREDVFIANVLKSRPPGNRDPQPLEIEACRPYLFEQVGLIEPKVVCTLGNFATKLLSGNPAGITKVRGTPQLRELGGARVFLLPLFHPAAALRTPAVKETLRADFDAAAGAARSSRPRRRRRRRGDRERRGRQPRASTSPQPAGRPARSSSAEPRAPRRHPTAARDRSAGRADRGRACGRATWSLVSGEVGVGKTTLIRGACRALGVEGPVTSPTFTIGQRYRGSAGSGSPTSTSTGSPAWRARTRPCSRTTWARTRSPSSSGPARRGADLGRPALEVAARATPAGTRGKSSWSPHPPANEACSKVNAAV